MYAFRVDGAERALRVIRGFDLMLSVQELRHAAADTRYFHDAQSALAESLARFVTEVNHD